MNVNVPSISQARKATFEEASRPEGILSLDWHRLGMPRLRLFVLPRMPGWAFHLLRQPVTPPIRPGAYCRERPGYSCCDESVQILCPILVGPSQFLLQSCESTLRILGTSPLSDLCVVHILICHLNSHCLNGDVQRAVIFKLD